MKLPVMHYNPITSIRRLPSPTAPGTAIGVSPAVEPRWKHSDHSKHSD